MRAGKLLTLLFLLLLALPVGLLLLGEDRAFSENENRTLATRPPLSAEALLDGSFQGSLERWMEDQFPGRDPWMAAVTVVKKAQGLREIGGAWLGREGYSLEIHRPEDFDWAKYRRNLGYLRDLAAGSGVPAAALLVPSAAAALPELLPAGAEVYDAGAALEAGREVLAGVQVPDLAAALRAEPTEQVYYRTDHHWTAAGALRGYRALPAPYGAWDGTLEPFCGDFRGTTWSKTLDPAAEPDEIQLFSVAEGLTCEADGQPIPVYDETAAQRKDRYTVFLGGNHGLARLTGGCRNGKTLLVLKDSFANCLAPLLTADFETVLLVDLRYYPGSVRALLAREAPDALLFVYEMSGLAASDDLVKLLL